MTPNDVKIVAENIDDFIEVPDGIKKLRQAIFSLAVSGKLVPQDLKAGVTGATSWKLVRLNEVAEFVTKGTTPKTYGHSFTTEGVPFLRAEDIKNGEININAIRHHISFETNNILGRSKTKTGDVLLTIAGTIGRTAVIREGMPEMNTNQAVAIIRLKDSIFPDFLSTIFCSELIQKQIRAGTVKMAIPNFSLTMIKNLEIPLPPLSEQKRIVKKVAEVMKQLDELEVKKRESDEMRTRFARSAMHSLGKGESKIAFEHLAELIKTPTDLKELEGALLTLAVSGRLVSQDRKESVDSEPSKPKEVGGRKKKVKVFSEITPAEIPFEIPVNWKWVRLGSVFTDYSSGSTPSRGNDGFYKDGDTNWYKSGELNDGVLSSDSEEKITDLALEKCHLRMNKRGDLLIAMYGATAGRVAILDNEGTTNQAVWGGTPDSSVDLKYLFSYILQSRHQLLKTSSGAAQPNISGEKISAHVLPLPPLAEQKRIVKKIEEVMILINRLKQVIGEK